jgi:bile acid:Na+ symporter, BASS family
MGFARIAIFTLQASVFLLVFSIALRATWQDATSLFRRPATLARSLLSMNVVMPVFATAVALAFHLHPAIKIALVLLAVSPVPPVLPQRQLKAGGSLSYVYGLLAEMSLLSILVVPFAIEVLGRIFSQDVHIAPMAVAKVVVKTILLPLSLGILVHWRWPGFAERASAPLGRIANLMLLVAALPLLVIVWRSAIGLISHGAVLAMAAFCVVGVAVGHWLGGPDPSERSTLGLATACRHPGLAIAIAVANFPEQRRLVAAAVVLYLLVSALVLVPYTAWSKRRLSQSVESPGPQQRAA